MKKYLLFDLDGTLTDPKEGICTCVQYALASFGIEEPDLDKLEPFIGPPLKDSFMEFYQMDEEQAQAAVEKYRERFRDKGIFENKIYDGIPEMLRTLQARGMTLAVASSKPTVFVEKILEHFKIAQYFKVVVGSELDGSRANKDEVVAEALRRLFDGRTVERDKVYMIGDRKFDVEGAHVAGVESVGVTYGYGGIEELKSAKSDYIVRTVTELQKFLMRGAEERKLTPSQQVWQVAFPFLMFLLVRRIVETLSIMAFVSWSGGTGGTFLFTYGEDGAIQELTGNGSAIITAIGYIAGGIVIWGIARKMITKTAEDMKLMHMKEEPGKCYAFLGAACVGLALGGNLLLELLGGIAASPAYQAVAETQYGASLLIGLVCYGIVSPVAEELLFRGIIFTCMRRYMKLSMAMVISTALFALYHGNSVQGIYALVMGGLMVYAYEYFGDFRMPVVLHIVANVLVYILSQTGAASVLMNWPVCAVCLLCGVGGVLLLHKEKQLF